MNTIYVGTVPNCDICGRAKGVYDSPINGRGTWANMCEGCFKIYGNEGVASKRVVQSVVEKKNEGTPVTATVLSTLEEMLESSCQVIKCPLCDTRKKVEVDASGSYDCQCGAKVWYNAQL